MRQLEYKESEFEEHRSVGSQNLSTDKEACSDTSINKSSENLRQNLSTHLDIQAGKQSTEIKWDDVPYYVKSYQDVFAKENFDKLPERKPWDHAIELIPGDHLV